MKIHIATRRIDALNPFVRFRSAITGQYVSRWYALLNPAHTVREKRWLK